MLLTSLQLVDVCWKVKRERAHYFICPIPFISYEKKQNIVISNWTLREWHGKSQKGNIYKEYFFLFFFILKKTTVRHWY